LSPVAPNAGAAPAPPKTNGCPAGAAGSAGAGGAAPNAKMPPAAGAAAGAAAPKLKEGVAEKAGGGAAGAEVPKLGAAEEFPKTEPDPNAGAEEAPKAGVEPKPELVDGAPPKDPKAGAAGASGFGAAAEAPKEKRPLFDSAGGFEASLGAALPPKLKTGADGALEKLNPLAAGAEVAPSDLGVANEKAGPADFFAADSPVSSSLVLFMPSVDPVGLAAALPNVGGAAAAVEELAPAPKVKRLGAEVLGLAASDDPAEKLKTGLGASFSAFFSGS